MSDLTALSAYFDRLKGAIECLPLDPVMEVVRLLRDARREGRQVFILGNGGSAATASHFACDLGKGTVMEGIPRFRAMALTDNMALFSALANDLGYEKVFAEQLENLLEKGDVVIAISGSGNSPNVLEAVKVARHKGAKTIGFTGFSGGSLKDLVELCIIVPLHDCIEQAEDVHLILEHAICCCLRDDGDNTNWAGQQIASAPLDQILERVQ